MHATRASAKGVSEVVNSRVQVALPVRVGSRERVAISAYEYTAGTCNIAGRSILVHVPAILLVVLQVHESVSILTLSLSLSLTHNIVS